MSTRIGALGYFLARCSGTEPDRIASRNDSGTSNDRTVAPGTGPSFCIGSSFWERYCSARALLPKLKKMVLLPCLIATTPPSPITT